VKIILGGDLNFSLGEVESWGPRARPDPLTYFFNHMLRRMKLIDIPPIRLCSTWRNKRVGEDRIEKHLDHFLVSENLVEYFREFCDAKSSFLPKCPIFELKGLAPRVPGISTVGKEPKGSIDLQF
jgi:hypothetical protein